MQQGNRKGPRDSSARPVQPGAELPSPQPVTLLPAISLAAYQADSLDHS
jgi:hypothetical protein